MYNEENMSKGRVQRNELLSFTESQIFLYLERNTKIIKFRPLNSR